MKVTKIIDVLKVEKSNTYSEELICYPILQSILLIL